MGSSVLGNKKQMGPQKSRTLTNRNPRSRSQKLHPVEVRMVRLLSKATVFVIYRRNHGHSPEKTMDSMDTHSDLPMVV